MQQKFLRNSTIKVAEALQKAITELAGMRKRVLIEEHILMTLVEQKDSIILKVFDELQLDSLELRRRISDDVVEKISSLPEIEFGTTSIAMKISEEVQLLFETADEKRQLLGDSFISTSALFLACFREGLPTAQLLADLNVKYEDSLNALKILRGTLKITEKDGESRVSLLDDYTVDITALARKGILDPVIGREEEIKRVIEILSRRKKNNPVLIGEPGVGKTVIVEGLAQQIANAEVPENLLNKRVLSLEIGSLIAGAKMQGEFEERLKTIKDEIIASSGEIILFIDEIHTVVGAGRNTGGLDASNMLKPALSRGLLKCLGATTLKEYKQYIEPDKALARRFQIVKIEEPSIPQAISILHGVKERYEKHHHVVYADNAIEKAVILSDKYIQQRQLPDKAIDLIDEAGAAKRMSLIYIPPEIRKIEKERLALERKKIKAFNERDFQKMAGFQMQISKLEHELSEQRAQSKGNNPDDSTVTDEDIARIVSTSTGIPVQRMIEAEAAKLRALEERVGQRVIGQHHAVSLVANAIRRNRSGISHQVGPIASFLFLGPSGVGKTELAKALAESILGDENKIIRLDMSEFMERHSVSRLIGSMYLSERITAFSIALSA